jgi:hypothetical protein
MTAFNKRPVRRNIVGQVYTVLLSFIQLISSLLARP